MYVTFRRDLAWKEEALISDHANTRISNFIHPPCGYSADGCKYDPPVVPGGDTGGFRIHYPQDGRHWNFLLIVLLAFRSHKILYSALRLAENIVAPVAHSYTTRSDELNSKG